MNQVDKVDELESKAVPAKDPVFFGFSTIYLFLCSCRNRRIPRMIMIPPTIVQDQGSSSFSAAVCDEARS